MKLSDFAATTYHSQFGEDGMINHIFDTIGTITKVCVEFGAGDGIDCSNVVGLWNCGWRAILLEADLQKFTVMKSSTSSSCRKIHCKVQPTGPNSIDNLIEEEVDFISIDVDGNDYLIWREMKHTPRVVCIEFNPTIPPHISLYQEYTDEDMGFGASLKALVELAVSKGYVFVGASYCNAFFVLEDLASPFLSYERDPMNLFPATDYTFLATDYQGNAVAVGQVPPWGIHVPYVGTNITGNVVTAFLSDDAQKTISAYGAKYDVRWGQHGWPNIANPDEDVARNARSLLSKYLKSGERLIYLETTHISNLEDLVWILPLAEQYGYQVRAGGGVMVLVKNVEGKL